MEELSYKLVVISKIKSAISMTYSGTSTCSEYHECMELINDMESSLIEELEMLVHKVKQ